MQISNKEQYKREKLPDILKGFAIILVVLGHCIQEGSGYFYVMVFFSLLRMPLNGVFLKQYSLSFQRRYS